VGEDVGDVVTANEFCSASLVVFEPHIAAEVGQARGRTLGFI
jgi:hypothetical protein